MEKNTREGDDGRIPGMFTCVCVFRIVKKEKTSRLVHLLPLPQGRDYTVGSSWALGGEI